MRVLEGQRRVRSGWVDVVLLWKRSMVQWEALRLEEPFVFAVRAELQEFHRDQTATAKKPFLETIMCMYTSPLRSKITQ